MFGRTPVNIHVDDLVHIAWSHDVEGTAVHPVALLDQRQPTQLQVQRPPLHGAAAAKGRRAGGGGCMGAAASGGGGCVWGVGGEQAGAAQLQGSVAYAGPYASRTLRMRTRVWA